MGKKPNCFSTVTSLAKLKNYNQKHSRETYETTHDATFQRPKGISRSVGGTRLFALYSCDRSARLPFRPLRTAIGPEGPAAVDLIGRTELR